MPHGRLQIAVPLELLLQVQTSTSNATEKSWSRDILRFQVSGFHEIMLC